MNCIVIVCDTLRVDHCGPYHQGRPLNRVMSPEQPEWIVPTPNMDRLARRGTVFDNAWCGSTPCMPARRDIYTGRYEFLERGWGPLEDGDLDLPRQVSGPPNQSLSRQLAQGYPVSYMVTDHFHLWEQGAGNYHMGYTGFDFVRGHEADAWKTDPVVFPCPDDADHKVERHHRNVHLTRKSEEDYFCAKVFTQAADWLEANRSHDNFYVHIDCFDPHEPWDPPEEWLKKFDPRGYDVDRWKSMVPYDKWENHYAPEELRHVQARYAAMVAMTDKWLGKLLDKLDELDLWNDTMVIFTSDHGTYNGDHGRIGKLQTHQHDACGHIPFIVAHPRDGHGERRSQLVQLVDIYPTVLSAVGRPCPPDRHGIDLLPVLRDAGAGTRRYAISGMFGRSVTITDGEWILHQSPVPDNKPLYWYGHSTARFIPYDLGPYEKGRRAVDCPSWGTPTWLSDKTADPNEYTNLADVRPDKLDELQRELAVKLGELGAPAEQLERLGLHALSKS
ncbi:sulfatase [Paenibacillus sp. GCM10012303]|uniref:sulfatase n=1 Tax=Paenibacillus sp. GCM10012303 TaxID=3317340 RepID=UPI00362418BD